LAAITLIIGVYPDFVISPITGYIENMFLNDGQVLDHQDLVINNTDGGQPIHASSFKLTASTHSFVTLGLEDVL
jgi:hypothetical protein